MRLVKYSTNQLDDLFRLTPYSVGFDSMFDRLLNTPETASGSYPGLAMTSSFLNLSVFSSSRYFE